MDSWVGGEARAGDAAVCGIDWGLLTLWEGSRLP